MRRSGAHSGKSRCRSAESFDVGVAGIHRLFANDTKLRDCDVLIVAAGMEGALQASSQDYIRNQSLRFQQASGMALHFPVHGTLCDAHELRSRSFGC